MTFHLYNRYRLGDCLWALHWLRKVALTMPDDEFYFYCDKREHWQLCDLIDDLPKVKLKPLDEIGFDGINTWVNSDGSWPPDGQPHDMIDLVDKTFWRVAKAMGIKSTITTREGWLFDFPALKKISHVSRINPASEPLPFFIDCPSLSGGFQFNSDEMLKLRFDLNEKHWRILTHQFPQWPVATIGALSITAPRLLMISTGPSWPTFNIYNKETPRIILLRKDHKIDYGIGDWPQFDNLSEAREYMEEKQWL